MDGFNPVIHLIFQEVHDEVAQFLARYPAMETPENWYRLEHVYDNLKTTLEEHPVRVIVSFSK